MKWLGKVFAASWAKKFSMIFSMLTVGFCLTWNIVHAGISGEWVTTAIAFLAAGTGTYLGGKIVNGGPSSIVKEDQ